MNRGIRTALVALVAGSMLAASGPATAASAPTDPPGCVDPISRVRFNATVVGTSGDDVFWVQPGAVVATFGGDDSVFTEQVGAGGRIIACLGDGADYFGPSMLGNMSPGTFAVRGEGGRDILTGGTGNDYLLGGSGSDIHLGGPGRDSGDAGTGADLCDIEVDLGAEPCEFWGVLP